MALSITEITRICQQHDAVACYHNGDGGQVCELVSKDGRLIASYYVLP